MHDAHDGHRVIIIAHFEHFMLKRTKNKKIIVNLSSAKLAQEVAEVNICHAE